MGEMLDTFRTPFHNQMLPTLLMRKFTYKPLLALDYAHDSGVIHTGTVPPRVSLALFSDWKGTRSLILVYADIKPDNIFVKFRDPSLIEEFLEEFPAPPQDRPASRYSPISSQSLKRHYFNVQDAPINMDIALGDWGVSSWTTKHLTSLIQPVTLRSPEVLISAPWDWTTDW